jgi:hypothetical protein
MRPSLAFQLLVCEALIACGGATNERSDNGQSGSGNDIVPSTTTTSEPAAPAAPAPAAKSACPWDVDALLRQVGALVVPDRVDCKFRSDCFAAAPVDPGAQFTVNNCSDCSIPTTYVSTPTPAYFAVLLENDQYGDAFREARVTRCSTIEFSAFGASCRDPEDLYSCKELRN